ncbi:MAG: 50S ribosomal protein L21 [bacterium]
MYAVVKTGGKQYRVSEGDLLRIEKQDGLPGQEIVLDQVLLVQDAGEVRVGTPFLEDVRVKAEILAQKRAKKVLICKFKRKKGYRKKQGHRQSFTGIRIKTIERGDPTLTGEASHGA